MPVQNVNNFSQSPKLPVIGSSGFGAIEVFMMDLVDRGMPVINFSEPDMNACICISSLNNDTELATILEYDGTITELIGKFRSSWFA